MREAFLTLLGHPAFHVKEAQLFDAFTPAEANMLAQFTTIGERYHRLECFVYDHDATSLIEATVDPMPRVEGEDGKIQSAYLAAVAEELNSTLQHYRSTVIRAEQKASGDNSCWGLNAVYLEVFPYETLLARLDDFVKRITAEKATGSKLMNLIAAETYRTTPEARAVLEKLGRACRLVFCRQLCCWLTHGETLDNFGEFFVHDGQTEVIEDSMPCFVSKRMAENIVFIRKSILENGPLAQDDSHQMARQLHDFFEAEVLPQIQLERFFDDWRAMMAKRAWIMMAENQNFRSFLNRVKSFAFLYRGDIWQLFLEKSESLLRSDMNVRIISSLKSLFSDVLSQCTEIDGSPCPPVALQLKTAVTAKSQQSQEPLENLELCFSDKDSFKNIFDDGFFEVANFIFRLLLRIVRTHRNLQQCWAESMRNEANLSLELVKRRKLRFIMLSFVRSLQYYFQMDIIEVLWGRLLKEFAEHRDIQLAAKAVQEFTADMNKSCFLSTSPGVYCAISKMLALCEEYCNYVMSVMANRILPSSQLMHEYYITFQGCSYELFKVLSSESTQRQVTSCMALLNCLDFSGYLTTA